MAVGELVHVVMRSGELALALNSWKADPAPHLDSTTELTLVDRGSGESSLRAKDQESWPCHSLPCHEVGCVVVISSFPCPLLCSAIGKDGPRVMRMGELALPVASYSTQKTRP